MSEPETTPEQAETGMWAAYEPPKVGEPFETLVEAGPFVLVAVEIREGIKTEHGVKEAVDLTVATSDANRGRMFSGFSAGIVGQAKRVGAGDLPAVCRIVEQAASRPGRQPTRGLELVERLAAGADLAAVAKAQAVPMMPLPGDDSDIPY